MNANAIRGHRQIGMACKMQAARQDSGTLLSGLISYWSLREPSGSDRVQYVGSSVGNLIETGGISTNTGLVYATVADWPADQSEADYLALANVNKGEIASLTGVTISRTIAFWMYMYNGSETAGIYTNVWDNGGSSSEGGEILRINQEDRVFATWGDGNGHSSAVAHGPSAVLNMWELWICQQDADNDEITIYKWPSTGIEEQYQTQAWTYGQETNSAPIDVCSPGSYGNATHRLGPIMVWTRVLSSGERTFLWSSGNGWKY